MPAQRIPERAGIPLERGAHAEERGGEGCEVCRLEFPRFEPATAVEQTDAVSSNEAAEGVADYTKLRDGVAGGREGGELIFDFARHTLAADVDAIVGVVLGVGFWDDYVELVLAVFIQKSFLERL